MQAQPGYRRSAMAESVAVAAPSRTFSMSEWLGLLALLLVVLSSPFLYDLAAAIGLAR